MAAKNEFSEVFAQLKKILRRHAPQLVVVKDEVGNYYVNTHATAPNGRPMCFGAVGIRKNYVSFYLMPVYGCPDLLKGISPALKKRMQGKSCFHFKAADPALFKELASLTKAGLDRFRKAGLA